jgi:hypothetical protein
MSAETILARFEKTARDMPHFTDQNRPEKVKDIFRALKREHPDMPAEEKARIAARQGKKGKQHQGPPYKGPIHPWKEKKSSISNSLDIFWAAFGPNLNDIEKSAASMYFQDLQRPSLNRDAFGDQFCKLAESINVDPWRLSCDVEDNIDAFRVLAKTASGQQKELAQFYVNWADDLVKRAGFLTKMLGGAGMERAAGNLTRVARRAAINPAEAARAAESAAKQTARKDTTTLGHKILGGTILGGLGLGGAYLAGHKSPQQPPQPQYY